MNRRHLPWSEKECKPKPCRRCATTFTPATSGNLYCSEECRKEAAKETHKKAMQTYRENNRAHCRAVKADWDLRTLFGITLVEYEGLLAEQNGGCAICGSTSSTRGEVRKLGVDHNHQTGAIRGLLCDTCNRGLGLFKDNPELLRVAACYLEKEHVDARR